MLSLRIALRYLFSRKSHNAVNIISLISLAGVAVATVAAVCVLSVFNGFADLAVSRLSGMDPQLLVVREDGQLIGSSDSLSAAIASLDDVEIALPTLSGQALAIFGDKNVPVTVKGVPSGYDRLTGLRSLVIDGVYIDPDSVVEAAGGVEVPWATLSVGVAVELASAAGFYDRVAIYVPRRGVRVNPANPLGSFAVDSVAVSAVFEVDQPEYDMDMVILPLDNVRELLGYDNEATAVEVKLTEDADERAVQEQLQAALGEGFTVKNRSQQQAHSFRMIQIEKWISFLLLAFILIIASFNIISTLSILIIEKRENIATMTALGAPSRMISRIFMLEGWLVSLGGGIVGMIVGVVLCLVQQWFGVIKLAADTSRLTIDTYPVKVEAVDMIAVLLLVGFVGLLSTAFTRSFIKSRVEKS